MSDRIIIELGLAVRRVEVGVRDRHVDDFGKVERSLDKSDALVKYFVFCFRVLQESDDEMCAFVVGLFGKVLDVGKLEVWRDKYMSTKSPVYMRNIEVMIEPYRGLMKDLVYKCRNLFDDEDGMSDLFGEDG